MSTLMLTAAVPCPRRSQVSGRSLTARRATVLREELGRPWRSLVSGLSLTARRATVLRVGLGLVALCPPYLHGMDRAHPECWPLRCAVSSLPGGWTSQGRTRLLG